MRRCGRCSYTNENIFLESSLMTLSLLQASLTALVLVLGPSAVSAAPAYIYRLPSQGLVPASTPAPAAEAPKAAVPGNCVVDAAKQVWCLSAPGLSGNNACGYAPGYAGPYYQVTAAAADALGKTILDYGDCGTNYTVQGSNPEQIRGWSGANHASILVCSTTPEGLAAKWSRELGGTYSAVARCTALE